MRNTYKAIRGSCEANGHERAGIEWEVYSDPDQFDHVNVEVCFLLQ